MNPIISTGRQRAFSLVEVTIALGVAGFCLLAIVGLLQSGLTSERSTVDQTFATGVLADIYDDLRATPSGSNVSSDLKIDLSGSQGTPQVLFFSGTGYPTGAKGSAATSDSRFRAGVQVDPITNSLGTNAVRARIFVSWPAATDPSASGWPQKQSGSVELVTELPRS